MVYGRLFSATALSLAVVMGVVPLDPSAVTSVQSLVATETRTPAPADDAVDEIGEIPETLSQSQVSQLLASSTPEKLAPVKMPTGDYSGLLLEAESVIETVEPLAEPLEVTGVEEPADYDSLKAVERSEFETLYETADGSYVSRVSPFPLNVEVDGQWVEASTEVTPDADKLEVEAHPLSPEFIDGAGGAVTVERDGRIVSFRLIDGNQSAAELFSSADATDDSVRYREVLPSTDAEYTVTSSAVKEQLVVHAPPSSSSWSWRLFTGGLTPRLTDDGMVELVDTTQKPDAAQAEFEQYIRDELTAAGEEVSADLADPAVQGKVVMHIPTPVVWDSSGVEGESSNVLINGQVHLERVGDSDWVYSIDVDPEWMYSPERVYPVMVDPTIQSGTSYVRSHKSTGVVYQGQAHVGNTKENWNDVYWRSFIRFNHSQYSSKFLADAQLVFGFVEGATGSFTGNVFHSTGDCYSCYVSGSLATYTMGSGQTNTTGTGIVTKLADRFKVGDTGVAFHVTGNEGTTYSHKHVVPELAVRYWNYPTAAHSSPATGLTNATLTPVLKGTGQTYSEVSGVQLHYRFVVATDQNTAQWVWNSGWTASSEVRVPVGALNPNTQYYWSLQVRDSHDGTYGQSTVRYASTPSRSFKTQKTPPTPPQSSAVPAVGGTVPATLTTVTPTLQVDAVNDADSTPGTGPVKYEFRIATGTDGNSGTIYTSALMSADSNNKVKFTVPQGVLHDGGVYSWVVLPDDGLDKNPKPTWVGKFKVDLRLGASGPSPFDNVGPVAVNLANGNANVSFDSPMVETLGGPMGMSFTYNSQSSTKAANNGLTAQYFDARDSNGVAPTSAAGYTFDGKQPVLVRTESTPTSSWGDAAPADGVPADHFLTRWSGLIRFPHASTEWRIGIRADDGARVRVGGTEIVSEWSVGTHAMKWSGNWHFGITPVPFQVDYFEQLGNAGVEIWVDDAKDSEDPKPLPADWLTRTPETLPAGWSASVPIAGEASAWSRAEVTASSIALTDATGAKLTFTKASGGGYTAPQGVYGTASLDASGRVVYTDEAGTVFQFSSRGYVETATPVNDAQKPASPIVLRDQHGKATAVVDPVSKEGSTYHRKVEFTYRTEVGGAPCPVLNGGVNAPIGMLCKITYPNNTATNLHYNAAGDLIMIEDPGRERTTFEYSNELMSGIKDPVANDFIYGLGGNNPHPQLALNIGYSAGRAANVKLPSSDGTAARLQKNYEYNTSTRTTSVSLQGVSSSTSTVTYDSQWRKLVATSPMGVSSSTQWHATKDLVLSETSSTGLKSTTVYHPVTDLPLHTYGPAPTACFQANGQPVPSPLTTAGCGIVPEHTAKAYDEGYKGLRLALYNNSSLSGQPVRFMQGTGTSDGSINNNWGTAAPTGVNNDHFSFRATGLIEFPSAGTYTFRSASDDGIRVWLDDVLIIDKWAVGQATADSVAITVTAANMTRRIRVEYREVTGNALVQLLWKSPASPNSFVTVPGTALKPDYGNLTNVTVDDSAPTGVVGVSNANVPGAGGKFMYKYPWLGQPTAGLVNPTGLNLVSTVGFEEPGTSGWRRRVTRTLPAGALAGAPVTAKTVYAYYADGAVAPNVCGVGGVRQFGAMKSTTGPTPASGNAVTTEYVYDVMGRTVGTRVSGDTAWSCKTFDPRERVTADNIVGPSGTATINRTVTYTPTATGLRIAEAGVVVAGSPNGSKVITDTDFIGQTMRYEDVFGTVTVPTYAPLSGRLTQVVTTPTTGTAQTIGYTYDADGKTTGVRVNGAMFAIPSYDTKQRLASVTYTGQAKLNQITRDLADRTTGLQWTFPAGESVSNEVVRSQAGRIIRDTLTQGSTKYTSTYTYDAAGRLVNAKIPGHELTYEFASSGSCGPSFGAGASGNRTRLTDVWTAPGSTALTTTTNYCYDWADRLLSSAVTNPIPGAHTVADGLAASDIEYDDRGNIIRLGDMTFAYDAANQHSKTTYSNGTIVTIARDASDRIVSRTTTVAGEPSSTLKLLYSGDSSSPWGSVQGPTLTTNVSLPGGALVSISGTTRVWAYPGIQGHTLTTGNGLTSTQLKAYEPYGQPLDSSSLAIGTASADDQGKNGEYSGWHQDAYKLSENAGEVAVIEMGARLYVPALGRFLQVDPIEGGVDNDYVWPTDPVGASDLDGTWDWGKFWDVAGTVASVAIAFIPGGAVVTGIAVAARLTVHTVRIAKTVKVLQAGGGAAQKVAQQGVKAHGLTGQLASRLVAKKYVPKPISYPPARNGASIRLSADYTRMWRSPVRKKSGTRDIQSNFEFSRSGAVLDRGARLNLHVSHGKYRWAL